MKVRKLIWPLSVVSFCAVACEDKNEASEAEIPAVNKDVASGKLGEAAVPAPPTSPTPPVPAPAPQPAAKVAAAPSAQEVCMAVTEAARAKDEAKFSANSTTTTAAALTAEGAKDHIMQIFGRASCSSVKQSGDTTIVTLSGADKSYEASFVKGNNGFKFDGAAFLVTYPPVSVLKNKKAAGHDRAKKAHNKHKGH